MPKYELTFVFDKDNSELPKKLEKYLKSGNAKVIKMEEWGTKSLAYPINKRHEAKYFYAEAEMEPAAAKELETRLHLDEELMRYLIVRV